MSISTLPDANVARVFVVQQPRPKANGWTPDLSSAREFGRIEFVFGVEDRPYVTPEAAAQHVADMLAGFDAESDYLLWPHFGDPAAMWIILMHLCAVKGMDSLRFLYWTKGKAPSGERSSDNGYYFPIQLRV